MQPHVDPILWRSRDSNEIAGHLVNVSMDTKQSSEEVTPPADPDTDLTEANFVMHCDAGTRVGTCSAAARILEARTQTRRGPQNSFLARKGIYMTEPISSFTAELKASEDCAVSFERFWATCCTSKRLS